VLSSADGTRRERVLTARDFLSMPGSLSRKGVLLVTSLYAPRFPPDVVGDVLEALGCSIDPGTRAVHLGLFSRKDPGWKFGRDITCEVPARLPGGA